MNTKEHDEFLQAQKDCTLDAGIGLCNGKWTICGVFNGKLSWTDLPDTDAMNRDEVDALLAEFVNEVDEPGEGTWRDEEPFIDNDGTTGF